MKTHLHCRFITECWTVLPLCCIVGAEALRAAVFERPRDLSLIMTVRPERELGAASWMPRHVRLISVTNGLVEYEVYDDPSPRRPLTNLQDSVALPPIDPGQSDFQPIVGPLLDSVSSALPVRLKAEAVPGEPLLLRLDGAANGRFTLERSADLASWTPIADLRGAPGEDTILVPVATSERCQFYRVRRKR
jgi:hypothetical protein